jgi:hypothetical protein
MGGPCAVVAELPGDRQQAPAACRQRLAAAAAAGPRLAGLGWAGVPPPPWARLLVPVRAGSLLPDGEQRLPALAQQLLSLPHAQACTAREERRKGHAWACKGPNFERLAGPLTTPGQGLLPSAPPRGGTHDVRGHAAPSPTPQ